MRLAKSTGASIWWFRTSCSRGTLHGDLSHAAVADSSGGVRACVRVESTRFCDQEERLTRRAKLIAKRRGTSVSRLVETFFTALEKGEDFSGIGEVETDGARGYLQGKPLEDAEEPSSVGYEASEWARRWRGAFAEEGKTS